MRKWNPHLARRGLSPPADDAPRHLISPACVFFVVAILAVCSSPCLAHWEWTITISGRNDLFFGPNHSGGPWDPNSQQSTYFPVYGSTYYYDWSADATDSGSFHVVGHWVHDVPGDKPPASVYVVLHGRAEWHAGTAASLAWSGTSSNGLGSPDVPIFDGAGRLAGGRSIGTLVYLKTSPADYDRDAVDPTIRNIPDVAMSAHFSGTVPRASGFTGNLDCKLSVDTKAADHYHPTNWQRNGDPATTPAGELHFQYIWDSTSGALGGAHVSIPDLYLCTIRENVTYSGDGANVFNGATVVFQPLSPPFGADWGPPLPNTTLGDPFYASIEQPAYDDHTHRSFVQPYDARRNGTATTFYGTQFYEYNCSRRMAANEWAILAGPITITETVERVPPYENMWQFRLNKSGFESTLLLGPSS